MNEGVEQLSRRRASEGGASSVDDRVSRMEGVDVFGGGDVQGVLTRVSRPTEAARRKRLSPERREALRTKEKERQRVANVTIRAAAHVAQSRGVPFRVDAVERARRMNRGFMRATDPDALQVPEEAQAAASAASSQASSMSTAERAEFDAQRQRVLYQRFMALARRREEEETLAMETAVRQARERDQLRFERLQRELDAGRRFASDLESGIASHEARAAADRRRRHEVWEKEVHGPVMRGIRSMLESEDYNELRADKHARFAQFLRDSPSRGTFLDATTPEDAARPVALRAPVPALTRDPTLRVVVKRAEEDALLGASAPRGADAAAQTAARRPPLRAAVSRSRRTLRAAGSSAAAGRVGSAGARLDGGAKGAAGAGAAPRMSSMQLIRGRTRETLATPLWAKGKIENTPYGHVVQARASDALKSFQGSDRVRAGMNEYEVERGREVVERDFGGRGKRLHSSILAHERSAGLQSGGE